MKVDVVSQREHRKWLFGVWYPIIVPLAAWAVHLVAESALVRSAQKDDWVVWLMHGISAVLAAVALSGIVVAWSLIRAGDRPLESEQSGTAQARSAFLGWLGLYAAGFNLLLILAEEGIITWVHVHA
jgi:uncharacterized membrane protein YozB (DUF420 family)